MSSVVPQLLSKGSCYFDLIARKPKTNITIDSYENHNHIYYFLSLLTCLYGKLLASSIQQEVTGHEVSNSHLSVHLSEQALASSSRKDLIFDFYMKYISSFPVKYRVNRAVNTFNGSPLSDEQVLLQPFKKADEVAYST